MSFWKGAIAPLAKHRDFQHPDFQSHMLANSVNQDMCPEPVWCDIDPITGVELQRAKRYYILAVALSKATYPFLIPEHVGGGEPTDEDIRLTIDKYNKITPAQGRDINWYIDFERGINTDVIQFMRDHGLSDKMDFRWTDNETQSSAARP